jgi:HJR/Mrr/RecB family endonuclease
MAKRRKNHPLDLLRPILGLVIMLAAAATISPAFRSLMLGLGAFAVLLLLAAIPLQIYLRKQRAPHQSPSATTLHFNASATAIAPRQPTPAQFVADLRNIDWFQFEKVIEAIYSRCGGEVERRGGAKPDGGIDLVLNRPGERIAVQCKQWKTSNVGVKPIREFLGAMTHEHFTRGIFITLQGYTADAKALASQHNIEILNETGLTELLTRTNALSDPTLTAALQDQAKYCPKCEANMVIRITRKGINAGRQFWGCSTFPRCHYTMPG